MLFRGQAQTFGQIGNWHRTTPDSQTARDSEVEYHFPNILVSHDRTALKTTDLRAFQAKLSK